MFKKISLDRVRLRNRIAPYECRMRFALNRMTISNDRMTALHNRMRIVFDRVQERGNGRTRWSYGGHTVRCKVVRCSYGAHTVV